MFCNNCGKQNPENAKFCNHCGLPVSIQTAPIQRDNINQERMQVRNSELAEIDRMIKYFSLKSAQYAEYDRLCPMVNKAIKGEKVGLLVWGIIVLLLGFILLIFTLLGWSSAKDLASVIPALFMYLSIGVGLIVGHIFYAKSFKKKASNIYQLYDQLTNELFEHYKAYGYCPIGPEYTNPSNLVSIFNTIRSGRADTTKDAINVLVEDSYRYNMQKIAAQTARSAAAAARGAKTTAVFSAANFFLRR